MRDYKVPKELVVRIKNGNIDALEVLFTRLKQDVYSFAFSYFRSKELAEEVVQEVFIRLWEKRELINPDYDFVSYIFKIAKNIILDQLREQARYGERYGPINPDLSYSSENADDQIIFDDFQNLLQEAVDRLPPKRKYIFQLSREEKMTYAEISEHLNISVNVVENQMSKALKHIRQYLLLYTDSVL